MSHELEHIWSRVQAQLALVVDESTYRIWLEPLQVLEHDHDTLLVEAPPDACGWIRERFGRAIQASVELVLGPDASVEITGSGEDGARAEAVGQPAAQRHEYCCRHQVDGNTDADAHRRHAEARRHLRQGGIDDGAVEQLHEECTGNDAGNESGISAHAPL